MQLWLSRHERGRLKYPAELTDRRAIERTRSIARVDEVKAQANGRGASGSGGHIGRRGQAVYHMASLRPCQPPRLQTTAYLQRFAATRGLLLVRICERLPSTVPGNKGRGSPSSWVVTAVLCMASYGMATVYRISTQCCVGYTRVDAWMCPTIYRPTMVT